MGDALFKLNITDNERKQMVHTLDLMQDVLGNDVITGLSLAETQEFWPMREAAIAGRLNDEKETARYLELSQKRDDARAALFKAEKSGTKM
jgi:hypothetical protein